MVVTIYRLVDPFISGTKLPVVTTKLIKQKTKIIYSVISGSGVVAADRVLVVFTDRDVARDFRNTVDNVVVGFDNRERIWGLVETNAEWLRKVSVFCSRRY